MITGVSSNTGAGVYMNTGSINTGDGNDTITGSSSTFLIGLSRGIDVNSLGSLDTGKGKDIITGTGFYGIVNSSLINTGDDDDIITGNGGSAANGIYNNGTFNTGDGNDIITGTLFGNFIGFGSYSIYNSGMFNTGDGNDIITATGPGDGIYNSGMFNTGDGNDIITATGTGDGIYNNGGNINTGDGNDSIIANEGFESGPNSSGAWFLGEGDDYIKGYGSGDFYGGNGFDKLELTPGSYTLKRWADNTGESVVFTKGNSLMITSEFEKLIAGDRTYDFTTLTEGQIIVVA
jgi:hypothetical protein